MRLCASFHLPVLFRQKDEEPVSGGEDSFRSRNTGESVEVMEYVGFLLMTAGAALVDMAGFNILPYACFAAGLMMIFAKALLEEKENENCKSKN